MPGFIKTPADEKKWNAIKHSVAKQRGKSVDDFTDREWATVNAAWHKSEYEGIKKSLFGLSNSGLAVSEKVSVPSGMKMPKPKKMPTALDKPSKFFKNEQNISIKHPSIGKLRDFLQKKHRAKCE